MKHKCWTDFKIDKVLLFNDIMLGAVHKRRLYKIAKKLNPYSIAFKISELLEPQHNNPLSLRTHLNIQIIIILPQELETY